MPLRAIGFSCSLLDAGYVQPFRGIDADLQRSTAQRSRASRQIGGPTANGTKTYAKIRRPKGAFEG